MHACHAWPADVLWLGCDFLSELELSDSRKRATTVYIPHFTAAHRKRPIATAKLNAHLTALLYAVDHRLELIEAARPTY